MSAPTRFRGKPNRRGRKARKMLLRKMAAALAILADAPPIDWFRLRGRANG